MGAGAAGAVLILPPVSINDRIAWWSAHRRLMRYLKQHPRRFVDRTPPQSAAPDPRPLPSFPLSCSSPNDAGLPCKVNESRLWRW
jgi:hypothetical protein